MTGDHANEISEAALSNGRSIVHRTFSMCISASNIAATVEKIVGQQYIDRQMGICWAQAVTEFFLYREEHEQEASFMYLSLLQGAVVMYLTIECMPHVPTVKRGFLRRERAFASPEDLAAYMNTQMDWLFLCASKELDGGKDLYGSIEEALSMWWLKTWGFSGQPAAGLTMVHAVMLAKDWHASRADEMR
jgi:hypothetical protein